MLLTRRIPSWKALLAGGALALLWVFAWHDGFGHAFYPTRRSLALAGITWLALTLALGYLLPACGHLVRRLPGRERVLYALLGLGLGAMMLTFLPYPNGQAQIVPHRLQVTGLNRPDCRPATLVGFETEKGEVSYATLGGLSGWQNVDLHLVSQAGAGPLTWAGYVRDAKLTFQGGPGACPVQVRWDSRAVTYPLGRAAEGLIYVHDALVQPTPVRVLAFLAELSVTGGLIWAAILALIWACEPVAAPAALPEDFAGQRPLHWLWFAAAALISLVVYALATQRFGLLLSTDTASYVSASRSLAAGNGYIQANGDVYDWWPPLYPFLLALGWSLKGLDPRYGAFAFQFARWLNLACYGLTVFGWGLLLRRIAPKLRPGLLVGMALLAGLSPVLYQSDYLLLSEPVFLLAITFWLVFFERYLRRGQRADLALMAVFAGLVALARYVGVLMIGLAALGLLLAEQPWSAAYHGWARLRGWARAGLVGLLAALPIAVWVDHNLVGAGTIAGLRTPALISLGENTRAALISIAGFFGVQPGPLAWAGNALVVLLVLGGLAGLGLVARQDLRHCGAVTRETGFALGLAGLAIIYSVVLVVFLSINANSPIGIRYMGPAYLPMLLALIYAGYRLVSGAAPLRWLGWGLSGLLAALLMWAGGLSLVQTTQIPVVAEVDRISIYAMQNNQLLDYVRQHPFEDNQPVYSNCPRCLIFFAEVYNVQIFNELPENQTYLPKTGQPFTLIWFNGINSSPLSQPVGSYSRPLPDLSGFLGRQVEQKTLFESADGVVEVVSDPQP